MVQYHNGGKLKQTQYDREGFEIEGIVETVTKEPESEDPFENLITDHRATLSSIALTVDILK